IATTQWSKLHLAIADVLRRRLREKSSAHGQDLPRQTPEGKNPARTDCLAEAKGLASSPRRQRRPPRGFHGARGRARDGCFVNHGRPRRAAPTVRSALVISIRIFGTCCRGGPPWPPVVLANVPL